MGITQEEVSAYLDLVRETGQVNMFGAGKYVEDEFNVTKQQAKEFLISWMNNFGKEQNEKG